MEDFRYSQLVDYLSTGQYPSSLSDIESLEERKKTKRQLRSQATAFTTQDGMLYHKGCRVLRKNEVQSVIKRMHEGAFTGGHLGRDKTLSKVANNYYWRGMKTDVTTYIKNCDACCRVNPKTRIQAPELISIPVPSKVWSLVGIDIIGPFQTSRTGNKSIVAATDHFSKWSEAAAIPTKSAKEVARFLLEVISRLGPMDSLISDQGREFVNQVIDEVTTALDIEHRISSPYHPQTNGQRERDNRTLKASLTKHAASSDTWDEVLPGVMFGYRISKHASTKYSPFELMYNRQPKIASGPPPSSLGEPHQDTLQKMTETATLRNQTVSSNIKVAQERQKKNFDACHSPASFQPGTRVLIKNAKRIRRFGDKLTPMWIGPYLVIKDMGKGRVKLMNIDSARMLSNTYNSCNLKEYTPEPSEPSQPSQKKTPSAQKLKTARHTKKKALFSARNVPRTSVSDSFTSATNSNTSASKTASNTSTSKTASNTSASKTASNTSASKTASKTASKSSASKTASNTSATKTASNTSASKTASKTASNTSATKTASNTSASKTASKTASNTSATKTASNTSASKTASKTASNTSATKTASNTSASKTASKTSTSKTSSENHRSFHPPTNEVCRELSKRLGIAYHSYPSHTASSHLGKPKVLHKTKGDGNCFFRAIAHAVSGTEVSHLTARDEVVKHMKSRKTSRKLQSYLNQTVPSYMDHSQMDKFGTWATDAEIVATASPLDVDIYVYCRCGLDAKRWARYPRNFDTLESHGTKYALYLANDNNVHFNVVMKVC